MLNKTAIYGLGIAATLALVGFSHWGESKFPSDALRADVASETALSPNRVEFSTDYAEATLRAERENKPILFFFMTKNCRYSREMLEGAFADEQIARLSRDFVCVEIDVNNPENESLCEELNVTATPTIQFATSRGVLLQRLTRSQTAERLANQMNAARTTIAWRAAQSSGTEILR